MKMAVIALIFSTIHCQGALPLSPEASATSAISFDCLARREETAELKRFQVFYLWHTREQKQGERREQIYIQEDKNYKFKLNLHFGCMHCFERAIVP